MDNLISNSFEVMCRSYEQILSSFYPARGSTGFTEQNQVHNYINALKQSLSDENSVHWLEFPWADKSHHIDGMVFSPKHKTIFYIEAKRISISGKKNSIMRDIQRVIDEDRTFISENKIQVENEYLIVLSDVWLEDKWKTAIPSWWCGIDNLNPQLENWEKKVQRSLSIPKSTLELDLKVKGIDWSGAISYSHWVGEKVASVQDYCLMLASKKI